MAKKTVTARAKPTSKPKAPARKAASRTKSPKPAKPPLADPNYYHLRLYVAGQTRKSLQAVSNLKQICDDHLQGRYSIEVVDLLLHPELARADQILALPTLVRKLPAPIKKIIGDLSHTERVLIGLDVTPTSPAGAG